MGIHFSSPPFISSFPFTQLNSASDDIFLKYKLLLSTCSSEHLVIFKRFIPFFRSLTFDFITGLFKNIEQYRSIDSPIALSFALSKLVKSYPNPDIKEVGTITLDSLSNLSVL